MQNKRFAKITAMHKVYIIIKIKINLPAVAILSS